MARVILLTLGTVPFVALFWTWGLVWLQFELWIDWVGTSQLRLFLSGMYWVVLLLSTVIWWVVQIPCWILKHGTLKKSAIALTIFWLPASGILWVLGILTIMWLALWQAAYQQECK